MRLKNNATIFLFLDYDGTLVPIEETPQQVVTPKATKGLLRAMARDPLFTLAIISGRSLKDVRTRVGVKNIIYAGNHGLEISGPGIDVTSKVRLPRYMEFMFNDILDSLSARLAHVKGVLVENKGLTASIHYRLVRKNNVPLVKRVVAEVTLPYIRAGKVTVSPGKKVLEVKPAVNWDKGKAVRWILKKLYSSGMQQYPVYIGDDITDESAFEALRAKGATIFVGKPGVATSAQYRVADYQQVLRLLEKLKEETRAVVLPKTTSNGQGTPPSLPLFFDRLFARRDEHVR